MDSIIASIIFGADSGGSGGGMPTPTASNKILVSNDSLEWEEKDSLPQAVNGKFLHINETTGAFEWIDVDFSTKLIDSQLTEAQILAFIVQNTGKEVSGFFFNSDINAYCSFSGLYMSKTVSGTEVHYGYCIIRGIHETEYLVDYRIDFEDDGDWYKVKIVTDSDLDTKADVSTVYTKTETNNLLANKADISSVYTKVETNSLLANKADTSSTYTKTETDNLLVNKADTSSVYTKTEISSLLANKVNSSDVGVSIASLVNGKVPLSELSIEEKYYLIDITIR